MTASMILLLALTHAPSPKPKPPVVPAIVPASVTMTWLGTPAETHFHPDGFFACKWYGHWWNGQWSQKDGVLTVKEWPLSNPGLITTWTVKLKSPTEGNMGGGSSWLIVPLKGREN